jgi:putative hydrolase of the HAD superfamily
MCPIKLVGFDLDDCLFDSTGLSERARIKGLEAMMELGLKMERSEAINLIHEIVAEYGSNSSQHYDFFLRRLNEIEEYKIALNQQYKLIAAAVMAYHQEKIRSIKVYDDVIPCLEKLRGLGIKTAVISDGIPIKQYEKILRLKIDKLLDKIVISDEIGIRKPNPKLFNYFLNKFGVNGYETIYVGDNFEKDIQPAKLNHIYGVYIHRGGKYDVDSQRIAFSKNSFEIQNLKELFPLIDVINKK